MKKWRNNGLSIIFFLLFLLTLVGQAYTGLIEHNEEMKDLGKPEVALSQYLSTGHFLQATFENWESEFLQMASFIILSIFLYQKGSSESKDPDGEEEVDKAPDQNKKEAPWPVHKGGLPLAFYKNSLSIAMLLLFVLSFLVHWYGSLKDYNEEQLAHGKPAESFLPYFTHSRLWFESFQNWQSEFLSVFAIVILSIYLRQQGSPQSKPVDAPHSETGE